ncbi:DICT sensory domain-containing protein [Spirulina subsalsa]|uniref:DICT sensory domain-containing protein n=1 Tax=Spirulina subsalsa TaxID=54311 RepID=UPI000527E1B2|nr:DICT sensory domain-containing protein [Spirulina subsalsa]
MSISTSILADLLKVLPDWRPQMYFKSSLIALSHAMEDQVLAGSSSPLVIATFQQERFYRQEAHRYRRIAQKSDQVYVLAAPETEFRNHSGDYETVAFAPTDGLAQEWHLVVLGDSYATCLICREKSSPGDESTLGMDSNRRFEGIWTFDRQVAQEAAGLLLDRILRYRPELARKLAQAKRTYLGVSVRTQGGDESVATNPDPFVGRLVTYLQVSQYKLVKAYRAIAAQEKRERLIHLMTVAIRRSLNPEEILQVAVEKVGQVLGACRCLIYRCRSTDTTATITHEFLSPNVPSLQGITWPLTENPLFQAVITTNESAWVKDAQQDPPLDQASREFHQLLQQWGIRSWLLVPVFYQERLLGIVELQHCGPRPEEWTSEEIGLVEAIANQVGVALIQAEAYAHLEDLNQQLAALDRTRSNLVAITGHELRTPLSTIQVCLESLSTEPDMPPELRQVMLNTALSDAERMRKLIQDFLTLSKLESGRVDWNPEPLALPECIDLGLSHIRARHNPQDLPQIITHLPENLPLIEADGEWLVEVLAKLLDNACKFTPQKGNITISAQPRDSKMLQVTVTDTGRGIEPKRLETVFDRFYQEEGALQRTTGGTGLGLAICRQIIQRWGGIIWAESQGKDQGSSFHFTLPMIPRTETPSRKRQKRTVR